MKKLFCILITCILVLSIGSSFATDYPYYWNIENLAGVLYKVETVIGEEKYECPVVDSSRDCQYYYATFTRLTVLGDIDTYYVYTPAYYSLNFTYVNKGYDTIYTKIDASELELFGKFLKRAESQSCFYNSCDGTIYTVRNTADDKSVRINKDGLYVFMKLVDFISFSSTRLDAAKAAK